MTLTKEKAVIEDLKYFYTTNFMLMSTKGELRAIRLGIRVIKEVTKRHNLTVEELDTLLTDYFLTNTKISG